MASQDMEKHVAASDYNEHVEKPAFETEFTPQEQKKIIHRVDRRLVLTVGILYCISLMDRTNLSAAAIAGSANPSRASDQLLTMA